MFDVFLLTLGIGLNIALPAWVVRRDLRHLEPEAVARAWNEASFWSAVVVFGPLCLPIHFARVRRSVKGFALGAAWTIGVLVANGLVQGMCAYLLGIE